MAEAEEGVAETQDAEQIDFPPWWPWLFGWPWRPQIMNRIYRDTPPKTVRELVEKAPRGPNVRERIFKLILDEGGDGLTSDEMEQRLQIPHQTCSARVSELAKEGRIKDSGKRRLTRQTKSPAVVYIINEG
jgi:hypothetical protein